MILEIRHYKIKAGRREEFITFFEQSNRQALRDAGMLVFGPLRDLEDQDKVHWMRAFASLEEREATKARFYEGDVWHQTIEPIAMSLIEHMDGELTETTADFQSFDGRRSIE